MNHLKIDFGSSDRAVSFSDSFMCFFLFRRAKNKCDDVIAFNTLFERFIVISV